MALVISAGRVEAMFHPVDDPAKMRNTLARALTPANDKTHHTVQKPRAAWYPCPQITPDNRDWAKV